MNSQINFLKWVLMTRLHKETKKLISQAKGSMVYEQNSLFLFPEDLHNTGIDCFANYCACLFSITVSIIKTELVLKHFDIFDIFNKIWIYNFIFVNLSMYVLKMIRKYV